MGLVLRKPGTIVEQELGDLDGTIVVFKTPDEKTAREINRALNSFAKNSERFIDAVKIAIGAVIVSLKGIEIDGSSEIQIETDGSGRITEACFETIMPLTSDLLNFVMNLIGLTRKNEKNF